jgi:hypothetical protein
MKTTAVTTTIYNPTFLKAYAENSRYFGHKNVAYIVVADKKTPPEAEETCAQIDNCLYMSVEVQEKYLEKFPELSKHLPWNTIARRNVGHLKAYENGADAIVMLDDDNLATSHDWVTQHGIVGQRGSCHTVASRSGWCNVCDVLEEEHGVRFYPRGYPPAQRWNDGILTRQGDEVLPAVNAGLWINDPDIDALTRLERRLITTGFKEDFAQKFALYPGTWCPWNCQNTAISRDALPSYFLSPYTGRHLDIWASYITTKCVEAMGQHITFGVPLSYHDRSPHNLYKDLEQELPWIQETDSFVEVLRNTTADGSSYYAALGSVIRGLADNWHPKDLHMMNAKNKYLEGLMAWLETFARLGAKW